MSAHPQMLGRYEIVDRLAEGGMAELFLARLPGIEGFTKRVVIKRVLPTLASDREFVQMFLEEARLAATLHHQNIVQVQDIGQDEAGFFFAMEYLHGADVSEIMRTLQAAPPLEIVLEIVRGACAGLHYAHTRTGPSGTPLGIVHRDISPQNLFVTFDGSIKLLDFGIAKAVQQISSHYTRSGTLRGKLPYMSPEQCQGEKLDRRSDVFSLSVVLWEMTVGERLFGSNTISDFEVLKSIVEKDAPPPSSRKPDYPPALEAIVMKGLARDRARRYQTCDELQADLEAFMRSTNRWATPRDVAAFMKGMFADRAASSLRLEAIGTKPAGELVPFPGTRVVSPPATDVTIDLPKPDRVSVKEAPPPPPARAGTAGPRVALLVGGAVVLTAAAMTGGFLLARRGSAAPSADTHASAAEKPPEDAQWFQPDDVLLSTEPFTSRKLGNLIAAKPLSQPDVHGSAEYLTATGEKITTQYVWATHMPKPGELAIGKLAFCNDKDGWSSGPPKTKADFKLEHWTAGLITDVADLATGRVRIADVSCELIAARVPD